MKETKKPFNKREWLLLVCFLGMLEFLVFYISYLNDSKENLLNFLSLSGTIVSIILALLAIIYSFYQSFIQQISSDSITRQLANLNIISHDIKTNNNAITSAVNSFSSLESRISETYSTLCEFKQTSNDFYNKADSVFQNTSQDQLKSPSHESPELDKIKYLISEANTVTAVSLVLFYKHDGETITAIEMLYEIEKLASEVLGSDFKYQQSFPGAASSAFIILEAFGLLQGNYSTNKEAKKFELSPTLKKQILTDIIESGKTHEHVKHFIEKLNVKNT